MKKFLALSQHATKFRFGYILCIALTLSGCGSSTSVPPVKLTTIVISPDPVFIGAGTTLNLTATGKYSNGTTADLTSQVVWTTADHLVATVGSTGMVTAVSTTGATTTVTAALSGVSSRAVTVTVTQGGSSNSTTLEIGRYDHTATLLPDGRVLVTGGYDGTGALTSSELYDPSTGFWSKSGDLNTKRGDHTAVLLSSGKVLAMGGVDGIGTFSHDPVEAELYDPGTGLWALTSSLNAGRSYHSITLLKPVAPSTESRVLVVGGDNQTTGYLDSAEIYDPATASSTGTWKITGSLSTARDSHTATLLNDGRVLVVGGFTMLPGQIVGTVLASAELYDPVLETWSPTGSLVKGRYTHSATLINGGKVLVVGGVDSAGNDVASAEIYDPQAGLWTPTGSLGVARYNHLATLMPSGQVLVTGGSNADTTSLSSAELYDPTTGKWTGTANLQTGRAVFTATLLAHGNPATDGKVLITGGDGATGTLSSVELHD
jgi:hypothetical protein